MQPLGWALNVSYLGYNRLEAGRRAVLNYTTILCFISTNNVVWAGGYAINKDTGPMKLPYTATELPIDLYSFHQWRGILTCC